MDIILNEKKYIEDIMSSSILPESVTPNMMITLLTKYYYTDKIDLKELTQLVCNQMAKFNLDITLYQEYQATNRIRALYNNLEKGTLNSLREYTSIPLYKSEYDKILSLESDKERKVLFTLYVLARYTNKHGWVYNAESDIYKLANTTKNKDNIISKLIHNGFVKCTKKVNDLKIGVDLSDGNENVVIQVTEVKYLGNQLLSHIKPGYITCEKCGKLVKSKSNRQKYCSKCAEISELECDRMYHKKSRN